MKVLVLGAGVIGITTAYYLHKDGHEVVVVDRQPGAGLETSFANAGGVCPSFAGPWAVPGMPIKVVRWLFARHAPLSLKPKFDPHQWRWLAAFIANCTLERFVRNKTHMQRIAHYSKACLMTLREEVGIAYDNAAGGVLQVFQTDKELDGAQHAAKVLHSFNVAHRLVDTKEAIAIEPALAGRIAPIAGALHLPEDETGDCHLFTAQLAELLRDQGVFFRYDTAIHALLSDGSNITGVVTANGTLTADCYVVALANEAPLLLLSVGIGVSIYPVKGYAITIENADAVGAPRSSVMDEHTKVMVTRLGNRVRAAGIAEVGGYDRSIDSRKIETVLEATRALFPKAGDYTKVSTWAGLRPMTPDGPAYLGATPLRNLMLNVGHGSNGWTQACGCGRIVADLVSGRQPDIDLSGMTLDRR